MILKSIISAALLPPALVITFLVYENIRFHWHKSKRKRALQQQDLQSSDSLDSLDETSWTDFNIGMITSIYVAGKYMNPFPEWQDRNVFSFIEHGRRQFSRKLRNATCNSQIETETPNFELLNSFHSKNPKRMTCTWFGQSTLFIQMDGLNILTDPHFSQRSTASSWFGPKRLFELPCDVKDLPPIDVVLVSHDHYDHLDLKSLERINKDALWIVPLGIKKFLKDRKVVELDWWEEFEHRGLLFVATPTQHWSGRYILDTNTTLWCSFVVKGPTSSFFHCGDTGYCKVFKKIGQKYGPISLAALPIGSYKPRWFMKHQHVNPEEAVAIHNDLDASYSIGVHWGTFVMSDEPIKEPPAEFLAQKPLSGKLLVSKPGETLLI